MAAHVLVCVVGRLRIPSHLVIIGRISLLVASCRRISLCSICLCIGRRLRNIASGLRLVPAVSITGRILLRISGLLRIGGSRNTCRRLSVALAVLLRISVAGIGSLSCERRRTCFSLRYRHLRGLVVSGGLESCSLLESLCQRISLWLLIALVLRIPLILRITLVLPESLRLGKSLCLAVALGRGISRSLRVAL